MNHVVWSASQNSSKSITARALLNNHLFPGEGLCWRPIEIEEGGAQMRRGGPGLEMAAGWPPERDGYDLTPNPDPAAAVFVEDPQRGCRPQAPSPSFIAWKFDAKL